MKNFLTSVLALILMLISTLILLPKVNAKDNHSHDDKENYQDHEGAEDIVKISDNSAKRAKISTQQASSQVIFSSIDLSGRIILNQNKIYDIKARFPGIVKTVRVKLGQFVKAGQTLATVESNDSLRVYSVTAPKSGIVLKRNTNIGNLAGEESIFTIADLSSVWAEFHVFPQDIQKINEGQNVVVGNLENSIKGQGNISLILPTADSQSQTIIAIVELPNSKEEWRPGMYAEAKVQLLKTTVPIAVNRSAIQKMENETVIFIKDGEEYKSRHVTLGRGDEKYIEVLDGLEAGEEYVSQSSFIIKADILKFSAAHSH